MNVRVLLFGTVLTLIFVSCEDQGVAPKIITTPVTSTPAITGTNPSAALVNDTITIKGSHFGTAQGSVKFGTVSGTILSWNDSVIKAAVPNALPSGSTSIVVSVNNQSSNSQSFKVITASEVMHFTADISPLFTTTYGCTGCHGGQNNLFLESYAQVVSGTSDHGPVIIAGNASGSIIVKKLRTNTVPFGVRMPFGSPQISDADLQKIIDWINQGALNK